MKSARIPALLSLLTLPASAVVNIDYVTVGNAGNAADPATGYGSVSYAYNIGKYEVTNAQYAEFLNAADPFGTNANGIYNSNMGSDARGGISYNAGAADGSKYSVKPNMGNKPVNYVSWYDAARFTNWVNNGQGNASTETGTYTLSGNTGIVTKNSGSSVTVWLPSEHEWYKSAYYDPTTGAGGGDNYWQYPTQSNTPPTVGTANITGDISNPGANVANYNNGANWNSLNGNVSTIGSGMANNYFGTADQGGNVAEWNDAVISVSSRGFRGGSWNSFDYDSMNSLARVSITPSFEVDSLGFRLASIPEPSSLVLTSAAICLILRRKRPATTAAILLVPLLMTSCSELGRMEASVTGSSEGGDVPRTLQFQNYRFRTGAAFKAAQLGAVGVKRTSGPNVFEIKRIPELQGLHLSRSASFTKTENSGFKMVGNVTISDFKGMKAGVSGEYSMEMYESGIYTIYYLPSTHGLVTQLNNDDNIELRKYIQQSKDFRIITALVKVNSHSLLRSQNGSGKVDLQTIDALQKEGTATATTENAEASTETADKKVEITDDGATSNRLPGGVSIADGGTYAYEYSRVIWDETTGDILDLLADHPGRWYAFTDHADHHYQNATHDPRKLVKVNR